MRTKIIGCRFWCNAIDKKSTPDIFIAQEPIRNEVFYGKLL